MQEIVKEIVITLQELVLTLPPFLGGMIGMIVIILESMIPVLPLAVFIALNMVLFGNINGFIMSWVATVIGCLMMFFIVKVLFNDYFRKKIKKSKQLKNIFNRINHINFSNLVILTSLPFTPAFLINIACGLSKMSNKKFILNIIISKLVIVYFWGYIGTSFLESITDFKAIIQLIVLIFIAYILSKVAMKKNKLD